MNVENSKILLAEFRPIPEFSNYLVDKKGNIYSCKRRKFLKAELGKHGYMYIGITNDFGKRKFLKIHRIVALTYIPKIEGKKYINHIDGNKQNNIVCNLEWCTAQENALHAIKKGLSKPQVKQMQTAKAIKKMADAHCKEIKQIDKNGYTIAIFRSSVDAAVFLFGERAKHQCGKIRDCANGLLNTAYGYKWCYTGGNHE